MIKFTLEKLNVLFRNVGESIVKIIKKEICPNDPKIEDFSFYTFRKTHLSQMAGNNCPIGELMKRAGHTKIETLYEYYYNRSSSSKSALDRALFEVAKIVR